MMVTTLLVFLGAAGVQEPARAAEEFARGDMRIQEAPGQGAGVTDSDIEKSPVQAILRKRGSTLATLRRAGRGDIVVVKGSDDQIEQILEGLEIPHSTIGPEQFPRADLSGCKILLINPHFLHNSLVYRTTDTSPIEKEIRALEEKEVVLRKRAQVSDPALLEVTRQLIAQRQFLENLKDAALISENVRKFVAAGGYVLTNNYGISILERAFPGIVARGGRTGPIMTVAPKPNSKTQSPLLNDVVPAGAALQWTLSFQSYLIRVEKLTVDVLLETSDLPKLTALAVAFSPDKKGKVLHLLPHFRGQTGQTTKKADYSLQNLLLNFLAERMNR